MVGLIWREAQAHAQILAKRFRQSQWKGCPAVTMGQRNPEFGLHDIFIWNKKD